MSNEREPQHLRALRRWAKRTYSSHSHQYPVDFSLQELENLAIRTPRCPLCDARLVYWRRATVPWNVWEHGTLDRKDNERTLSLENTWIICRKCNLIKSDFTFSDFVKYCQQVADKFSAEMRQKETEARDRLGRQVIESAFRPDEPITNPMVEMFWKVPPVDWTQEKRRIKHADNNADNNHGESCT